MMRIPFLLLAVILSLGFSPTAGAQAAVAAGESLSTGQAVSAAPEKGKAGAGENAADTAARAAADSIAAADPMNYTRPVYHYSPGGRRDPFESLVPEENKDEKKIKGLFNYDKASLRGIVRSGGSVYAMAVDADNSAYVLRENDPVFGGYVTKITDDAVQLHIVTYGRAMTIILRMETAKKTILSSESGESLVRKPGITVAWGAVSDSGSVMSVENVTVPSLNTKTVEEIWFGGTKNGGEKTGDSSPYLLLSPPDKSEIQLPVVLRWTKSPLDSLFTVVIAPDRDFRTPLLVKEGIRGSTFLLDSNPAREPGGLLYWKVIALHGSGEQIDSRNILSFRIK